MFIDTSRLLASTSNSYTSTEDCIVFVRPYTYWDNSPVDIWIDGVNILTVVPGNKVYGEGICIPLKNGQTISAKAEGYDTGTSFKVFGVKC